jgi:glycerol uptake facilitator-like aquaporin
LPVILLTKWSRAQAGYWFTTSTSFANPAVTIARSLSDTFASIAPSSVVAFIVAQLADMATALIGKWLWVSGGDGCCRDQR